MTSGTLVNAGGEQIVYGTATVNNGGTLSVLNGGFASFATINSGGLLDIADGGILTLASNSFSNNGITTWDTSTTAALNTNRTGSGQLTKNGTGQLTLGGTLSQSQVNLNAGSLVDTLTCAGSIVFVPSQGAFTPHTLTATNLTGNGGAITLNTVAGDSNSPG